MKALLLYLALLLSLSCFAQRKACFNPTTTHTLFSSTLGEERNYWVSLPLRYTDTIAYPVIYVLDAEWRFDLVKHIAFDLGMHNKIEPSIIVGIPHVDYAHKRIVDLTFGPSCTDYDGRPIDSTWYNENNSGGALDFYRYLTTELIPNVEEQYATNDHRTLIGHSFGGYFGGYLLSLSHPFSVIHLYDPSLWYNDGEVGERFQETAVHQPVTVYLTYQPEPVFHRNKVQKFIQALEASPNIAVTAHCYEEECHNSLFLDSFYKGIQVTNPATPSNRRLLRNSGME